jgi:hypothetical protein
MANGTVSMAARHNANTEAEALIFIPDFVMRQGYQDGKGARQMTLEIHRKMRLPLLGKTRVSHYHYKELFILTAVLLACLRFNHSVFLYAPSVWLSIPAAITLGLIGERYTDAERPAVRLLQLVGCLSALYSLLYYPLMPVAPEIPHSAASYAFLAAVWLSVLVCGVAASGSLVLL